jgi:hypothetical protein
LQPVQSLQLLFDGLPASVELQFDVLPLRARVDEYRLYSGRCRGCGKPHAGAQVAGALKAPVANAQPAR